MITHLVDSDWIIDYLRNRDQAADVLQPLIAEGSLAASMIVYAELLEGVLRSDLPEKRRRDFQDFFSGVSILGLDEETAEVFARLRAELRSRGELIADHDLWIAATALRHDLILLARDHHYDRIDSLKRP